MPDYNGQIDWGDWQQMPDYRAGWRDKHKSGIADLGRALDVTTYIPGLNTVSDFAHEGTGQAMTAANQVLSPVVKAVHKYTLPDYQLNKGNAIGDIHRFSEEKPADALAIAAATYFTAGAASGLASGGGGGAAAGGMAGSTAAGSAAITPTFASGAAGAGGAVTAGAGASAITPAFTAAGLSIAPEAAAAGGLGAAGTAAANSLLTPAFASWGGTGAGGGLLSQAKNAYNTLNKYDAYRSNLQRFAGNNGPTERDRANAQSAALADRILNAGNTPQTARQRITNRLMINKYGVRK
ncbi:MAG: hypothetical protein M0R47_16645 [Methylobacter sp.]|uniref:hypothetical protein n=1 Tax=Methylobacter sp. TaxID=2051955 RepID=UPI0025E1B950|nr:hypothetical protein [Methylobacter sp.]MCK9622151.1 hypothetical protein [Methylobacter sp.]